mmetsp:Transcript_85619/g.239117  ORF Transcript_85619/g.239117 Transcript_85619/m.239117 type:complete len:233 (+) Transcript_85619:118-816(+)
MAKSRCRVTARQRFLIPGAIFAPNVETYLGRWWLWLGAHVEFIFSPIGAEPGLTLLITSESFVLAQLWGFVEDIASPEDMLVDAPGPPLKELEKWPTVGFWRVELPAFLKVCIFDLLSLLPFNPPIGGSTVPSGFSAPSSLSAPATGPVDRCERSFLFSCRIVGRPPVRSSSSPRPPGSCVVSGASVLATLLEELMPALESMGSRLRVPPTPGCNGGPAATTSFSASRRSRK